MLEWPFVVLVLLVAVNEVSATEVMLSFIQVSHDFVSIYFSFYIVLLRICVPACLLTVCVCYIELIKLYLTCGNLRRNIYICGAS